MDIKKTPLWAESWNVAFRFAKSGDILSAPGKTFHIIPNTYRYWAADPLLFEFNNQTYIFAELYDYVRTRGIIGVSIFNGETFGEWKPVVIEDYHLSYPYVFSHDNGIYMIPETSKNHELSLYKATNFPFKWEKIKSIVQNVDWVDTTIIKKRNSIIGWTEDNITHQNYLLRFDSQLNLLKKEPFSSLKQNCSRCGGQPWSEHDSIVLVTQDCTEDYGKSLFFNFLDSNTLEIQYIKKLDPTRLTFDRPFYLDGVHTYSSSEKFEVIDLKTKRFSLLNFIFRVRNKAICVFKKFKK